MPLESFSVSMVSALLELSLHVPHLSAGVVEPDWAVILMVSIRFHVQPLPSPASSSSPQVHIKAVLPSHPDVVYLEWPPG